MKGMQEMTTAWADLPNAAAIDRVIAEAADLTPRKASE